MKPKFSDSFDISINNETFKIDITLINDNGLIVIDKENTHIAVYDVICGFSFSNETIKNELVGHDLPVQDIEYIANKIRLYYDLLANSIKHTWEYVCQVTNYYLVLHRLKYYKSMLEIYLDYDDCEKIIKSDIEKGNIELPSDERGNTTIKKLLTHYEIHIETVDGVDNHILKMSKEDYNIFYNHCLNFYHDNDRYFKD